MGRIEVQGIVAVSDNLPYVQFRQIGDDGEVEAMWQSTPLEAREMAQQVIEASINAIYDAAIVSWAKEVDPENWALMSSKLLVIIRQHRSDIWGLPDQPDDWRTK